MRLFKIILIIILLFNFIDSYSVEKADLSKHQEKRLFKKTVKLIYKGYHKHAKINLLQLLEIDSNNINYNYELALLYYYDLFEQDKSLPYLEAVKRLKEVDEYPEIYYYLGKAYHFVEQYDNAIKEYSTFKQYIIEKDKPLQDEIVKYINECNNAKNLEINNSMRIRNMGNRINTSFPEYVPVPINNDTLLLFTSKRPYIMSENFGFEGKERFEGIYLSYKKRSKFSFAEQSLNSPIFKYLDKKKSNNAIVSSSCDGNTLIVYRKNKLWTTSNVNEKWQEPIKVSKIINFSYYQPHASMTNDGNTIFFSSWNKKKGFGKLDIYYSKKQDDNKWGPPVNLGRKINTKYNEDSPEISSDGKTLYFSSQGHSGIGGYDIYKSELVDGEWSEPANMSYPLNSAGDDIFFKFNSKGDLAYFSSYRKNGFGNMDIYQAIFGPQFEDCTPISETPLADTYIGFNTADSIFAGEILNIDASDTKSDKYTFTKYFWKIEDKIFVDSLNFDYTFNCAGKYNIQMEVEAIDKETKEATAFCVSKIIKVVQDELLVANDILQLADIDSSDYIADITDVVIDENNVVTDDNNIVIEENDVVNNTSNENLNLANIYFDFDDTNIRGDAKEILDKNIILLKEYSDAKIKIVAHTDACGSSIYNQMLSERRARSVSKYLKLNGINETRIIEVIGKGETKLANNCKEEVVCSKEEHQLNRRAELIIVY